MLSLALLALLVGAPDAPDPFALTGTSTHAVPVEPGPSQRVERRRFVKADALVARLGASYLSRGDLRVNPGLSAELGWYPREWLGLDFVSGTVFFSSLGVTADALRRSTGLLPDSQKPLVRIATGARLSLAYGKLLVEPLDAVVHLDLAGVAHVGVLITDAAVNPTGDLGLAFQVSFARRVPSKWLRGGGEPGAAAWERLAVWAELSWLGGYEARSQSSIASGPMASLGLGVFL
jgi:hypothetical protein